MEPEETTGKADASLDNGCMVAIWVSVALVVVFAVVVGLAAGSSDNEKPSTDACTRAFIKSTEKLTLCYQYVGTGVSPPDAVVLVRQQLGP